METAEVEIEEDDNEVDDEKDTDFLPTEDHCSSTDTDTDDSCHIQNNVVEEPKYLVFHSCLQQLFKYCINCGGSIEEKTYSCTGSLLSVSTICIKGHVITWQSQPFINQSPAGNLLIASSILFTGSTFNSFKNFASCLNMKLFSEKTFYSIQNRYLFPAIHDT